MLIVDLILAALIAATIIWGYSRGVTVDTLALVGFGAGAVLGSRLTPLVLNGGLHSTYAPEVAIPGALLVGALSAALFERLGLRMRRRLDGLGLASPIGGALLGGALGVAVVWILGVVAVQVGSLRGDVESSAILSRLDAVLTPPGPALAPTLVYSDSFPAFAGRSPATATLDPLVTRAPGVRAASRSVVRVEVLYCHSAKGGSGWIAADGIVVTNAHVIAAARVAAAQLQGTGPAYPATPIWFDPKNDIALLRVPDLRGVAALRMVSHPKAGTAAAILGFPGGRWEDRPAMVGVTSNMVLGQLDTRMTLPREFSHELFGRWITALSGRSEHGNSGGPVVDHQGRVLATVFGGGGNAGLGVPNRFVRYALRHAGPQVGTGPCPPGSSQ